MVEPLALPTLVARSPYAREAAAALIAGCAAAREIRRLAPDPATGKTVDMRWKADHSEVTAGDEAAHTAIVAALGQSLPSDFILSEEGALRPPPGGWPTRLWILDPIDGTRDYLRGGDGYTSHIGLAVEGEPVVGVVMHPRSHTAYLGVRGAGAWLIRRGEEALRLAVSPVERLDAAIGLFSRSHRTPAMERIIQALPAARAGFVGSSLKWLRVAEASAEFTLYLPGQLNLWDALAPHVVASEAGATVSDLHGAPLVYDPTRGFRLDGGVLVTNGRIHPEMVAWFQTHGELWR